MRDREPRVVFETLIEALNRRDTAELRDLVHPDFTDTYPQSGERTRGFDNLEAIITNYPGGFAGSGTNRVVGDEDRWFQTPAFTLVRIEGSGDTFTAVQRARYPDGSNWFVVVIGEIRDGRVWRMESYFAPTFEPPAWRAPYVEIVPDPPPR